MERRGRRPVCWAVPQGAGQRLQRHSQQRRPLWLRLEAREPGPEGSDGPPVECGVLDLLSVGV
jgi:hypothetical protein